MKRAGWVAIGLAVVVLGGSVWYWRLRLDAARHPALVVPDVTAPDSQRVRVEVLNATRTRGLARRVTFYLRGRGFDVVSIGTTSAQRDSTLVIDRSNHLLWARRVAAAMGGVAVESRPDSTLYVDVTVLVGRTWRAPPEPLRP